MAKEKKEWMQDVSGVMSLLGLVLVIYVGLLTANAWAERKYIGVADRQPGRLNLAGEGKVSATPDLATATIGVRTLKDAVSDAQEENTTKVNNLIQAIRSLGVEQKDIQTQNYQIYPQYDYTQSGRELNGYEVYQSVEVKIRNLDNVGEILSVAGQNEANEVSGVRFTIENPENLREQARELAMDNVMEKKKALERSAGIKLGDIVGYYENDASKNFPVTYDARLESSIGGFGGGAEPVASPSIETGEEEVIINVNVEFEIL